MKVFLFSRYPVWGLVLAVTVISIGLVSAPVASAHIFRADGTMSAELHLPPDDAPVAYVPSAYELTFEESDGKFVLAECNCAISFVADGKIVGQQTLAATGLTVSRGTYIFPKPATYTLRVTGTPKNGATFKPFAVEYTERVGGKAMDSPSPLVWISLSTVVGGILIYAVSTVMRRRRQTVHKGTLEK